MPSKQKVVKILNKKISVITFAKVFATLTALFILYFLYLKGVIAIAFVNGHSITLEEVAQVVNQPGSGNFLDKMIAGKIIELEARKRHIEVTAQEVQNYIANIEKEAVKNGKTMAQILAESHQTSAELEKNVKTRITIYKILSENIDVTEREIDEYINQDPNLYKDRLKEEVRQNVKEILIGKKISEKYDNWLKEAKASYDIRYFINF